MPAETKDPGTPVSPRYDEGIILSLPRLMAFLWGNKWLIGVAAILGAILLGLATFLMQPRYRAEVVVSPVQEMPGVSGAAASLAQLSSLLLPGMTTTNRSETIAFLRSRSLAASFITAEQLQRTLLGESKENPGTAEPDDVKLTRAVRVFHARVLRITEDRLTGIVAVSVEWKDPAVAASIANRFMEHANEVARRRVILETAASLKYVRDEIEKTDSLPVRTALLGILERDMKNLALARTRPDFAFRIIDPARVSGLREYVAPRRLVFVGAGLVMGLGAGVLIALLQARSRHAGLRTR